jgi:DNA polymerase I-like protein with 3'-5' exonuclease and polymerase domains
VPVPNGELSGPTTTIEAEFQGGVGSVDAPPWDALSDADLVLAMAARAGLPDGPTLGLPYHIEPTQASWQAFAETAPTDQILVAGQALVRYLRTPPPIGISPGTEDDAEASIDPDDLDDGEMAGAPAVAASVAGVATIPLPDDLGRLDEELRQLAPEGEPPAWRWAATPPDAWHARPVIIDVETKVDGMPWMVGFAVTGERPIVCLWSVELAAWIQAHIGGWIAFHAGADHDFLARAGVMLQGRIDDLPLALVLVDERDWGGREDLDDSQPKARGLKLAAKFFLGHPDWTPPEILRARTKRALKSEWDAIPDEIMAGYCARDIEETVALCAHAKAVFTQDPHLRHLYETISRRLWEVLRRASEVGVPVDEAALRRCLEEASSRRAGLQAEVTALIGAEVNLRSHPQMAQLLYTTLGLPVVLRTRKGNPSVSKHALARLRGQHDVIDLLERVSDAKSEAQTYGMWLPWVRQGRLHVRFNVAGMTTGRVSTADPNLQAVPHGRARTLIRAPEGSAILVADYRTLEFGVAAWLYDEPRMLEAYLTGDPHTATATWLLGRAPLPATDERKTYGKTPNYGLSFQMSPSGFYEYGLGQGLSWTEEVAQRIYDLWHARYPGVRAAWARIAVQQRAQGFLVSPSGRRRRWKTITRYAERQGSNFIVQSTAAELCHAAAILAMTQSEIPALGGQLLLTGHDSLLLLVPHGSIVAAARCLETVMTVDAKRYFAEQFHCEVPIPLQVEIAAGPSWGEARPVLVAAEAIAHD